MQKRKKGPWTVLATRVAYENPWMKVLEDKVIRPDGSLGIFATLELQPGSTVVPLDAKGNVYLVEEYRYGVAKTILTAVGGGKDIGETYLAAAKRELAEETGISARKWTPLGTSEAFPASLKAPIYVYLAEDLSFSEARPEANESITLRKMPLKKALKLVDAGTISHAATAVALLKIARLKKTR